jgi:epoxyqueuosine reductase
MSFSVDDLKTEAMNLGFSLSGVARPVPPPHFPAFEHWLENGRQAGMAYLETERARRVRADPAEILPEGRSILTLGIRYPDPRQIPEISSEDPLGNVAAYAWGDDYHEVIPARLRQLIQVVEKNIGRKIIQKIYTDTGPILERDTAQQAGLGWEGKNTCLISPQQGSYFLLAEVFTDVDFEPSLPVTHDFCGSCRRCLEACPTDCILPDRSIDSRRCISYLTIENKGEIPEDLRPLMGNWIFGCDICQMVCPWNLRFSDPQAGFAFDPRPDVPRPKLRQELHLTPQEFNRKFHHSPIQRARRRGYLRNVCVALGNQPDPGAVPDLTEVLWVEMEPLVRSHSAWALGQINTPSAREALDKALKQEIDPSVLQEITRALDR